MAGVRVKVEGSIDKALRQFKKRCIDTGLFIDLKKRAFYEKPSEERRRVEQKKERTIKGIVSKRKRPLKSYSSNNFRAPF